MLKLKAQNNVVLGLTEENVKRLKSGEPIRIKGVDAGVFHQKKDLNAS